MNHEVALKPWAAIRQGQTAAPLLFTIDHHTDTRTAFGQHAVRTVGMNYFAERQRLLDAIRADDPATLEVAVKLLDCDEHINAAIEVDIVDAAIVLAHNDQLVTWPKELSTFTQRDNPAPPRPHTYEAPADRIFYLANRDGAIAPLADKAIETSFLEEKLSDVKEMLASLGRKALDKEPFIFDIDLDYFLTPKSLQPDDPSCFYSLLRSSIGVTIALEPNHVSLSSGGRMKDSTSLAALDGHLVKALGERTG